METIQTLMQTLGYQFNDIALLEMALTHRSVRGKNNERLEFLGDSILNFVIAARLYQQFPFAKEGELSRLRANLVNENTLAEVALFFNVGHFLRLGPGELKSGGARRKSILADAVEAIIGAIYLDSDIQHAEECVLAWFQARLLNINQQETLKDAKSRLQEYLQARRLPLPIYSVTSIDGEAHAQQFHIACEVPQLHHHTQGMASTRRAAEQMAAEAFLHWLVNRGKVQR